jgi:DNA-binding transcriptional LysR family regulator
MDTNHLANFLLLAQIGNMTRAASRMHLTQPALSGQIKRLEEDLGTPLFHRQGRGLVLTRAGEEFRRHAADALARLDAARAAIGAETTLDSGAIALGGGATVTTCLLPRLLGRFHKAHPGVRFSIREAPSRTIAEAVVAGEIDLGVVTMPLPGSALGGRLEVTPWVQDELVLLVPPRHSLSNGKRFRWKDLHNQPLIAFESGSAVRTLLDHALAAHGVQPSVVMELRAIASIANMVANGIGLGFVSRFAVEAKRGLRCADGAISRELAVVERRDRARSPALQHFRNLLLESRPD